MEYIQQLKRRETFIIGLITGLMIASLGSFWWQSQQSQRGVIVVDPSRNPAIVYQAGGTHETTQLQAGPMPVEESIIVVYIVGAVQNPGVFHLPEGSRLVAAVEAAGGFALNADREAANLAMVVRDGMRYRLPRIGEDLDAGDGELSSGMISSGRININTADMQTLQQLPNIGPARAQAIIDHRTRHGIFQEIDDIRRVSGIGDSIFGQLRDLITVR